MPEDNNLDYYEECLRLRKQKLALRKENWSLRVQNIQLRFHMRNGAKLLMESIGSMKSAEYKERVEHYIFLIQVFISK